MGDFAEKDKIKCLLWCNRHCCLCGKACGTDIEIAHIDPRKKKGSDHIDNAIPLCYECHSEIGRYNKEHPRGNKYRPRELKARREQIYEEYTRHLVPPIHFKITNNPSDGNKIWDFPKAACMIIHAGCSLPVKVLVKREIFYGKKKYNAPEKGHYSGIVPWNMNPGTASWGVIDLSGYVLKTANHILIRLMVTIVDQYERQHPLLPNGWVYNKDKNLWVLEP